MKKQYLILILFLFSVVISFSVVAQNDKTQETYLQGLKLLREGKPTLAIELFKPLTNEKKYPSYAPNALYLTARSYFAMEDFSNASLYLQELKDRFPQEEKLMNEAAYLNALIEVKRGKVESGIAMLTELKEQKVLESDVDKALTALYQSKLSTEKLRSLSLNGDQRAASQLVEQQLELPAQERDSALLADLSDRYPSLKKQINANQNQLPHAALSSVRPTLKKDAYHLSFLLPLKLIDNQEKDPNRRNQYAYDFQNGVMMAMKELEGSKPDLIPHFFDTEMDSTRVAEIVSKPAFQQTDVVIGPLFSHLAEPSLSFCNKTGTVCIQPLTKKDGLISKGVTLLQATPSYENVATSIINFVIDSLRRDSLIILYGESPGDTLLANYLRELASRGKRKVVLDKQVSNYNSRYLTTWLKPLVEDSATRQNLAIVALFENATVSQNLLSALELHQATTPIFAPGEWMENMDLSFQQFDRQNIFFYQYFNTKQIDYENEEEDQVAYFLENYINTYNRVPTMFSYLGYELVRFIHFSLEKHGKYFDIAVQYEDKPFLGKTLEGFHFCSDRANTYVPILRLDYREAKLKPATAAIYRIKEYTEPEDE